MIAPKTLMLVANPWAAIDDEGRPCGACRRDPVEDNPKLGYIGAVLKVEVVSPGSVRKIGKHEQVTEAPGQIRTWEFSADPVRVPNTAYYRDRAGRAPFELFPGDETTARYLGYKNFKSSADLVAAHRALRISEFDAQHGEGSWQMLEDERNPKQSIPPAAKAGK